MSIELTVVSLGAGVQSTTVVLLAAAGKIEPMPDCAIFADTGSEPTAVYDHLEWLTPRLPFPVHIVRAWEKYGKPSITAPLGQLIMGAARGENKVGSHARPPFFTLNTDGSKGMIRRQCTGDFKIDPINKKIRELLGLKPRQRWPKKEVVEQWMGISTDEAMRMKPAQQSAIRMRWPLIELHMSRQDCLSWLAAEGYPRPPKSACTFCPFHSDAEWRRLRDTDSSGWAEAVDLDRAIRSGLTSKSLSGALFLHPSCVPLEEVDFDADDGQLNLFVNECEGVCGL